MADIKEQSLSKDLNLILKKVSRTLYLSIRIMPEPVRFYMGLGYLVCRALDSVVDAPQLPRHEKLEMLHAVRAIDLPENRKNLAEAGTRLAPQTANPSEMELMRNFGRILDLYANVPEDRRDLLKMLFNGISEGMEIDVGTFDGMNLTALQQASDLDRYCHLIGGVPGIFWAGLYREYFLARNPEETNLPSDEDGDRIGKALQITNILKDMATDIKNGRCYIPYSDLLSVGMLPRDMKNPDNFLKLKPIVNKWIMWGVDNLDCSERFMLTIPKRDLSLRAAVVWPVYWAEDTFDAVAKANTLDLSQRPKISRNRIYSTMLKTPPILLSNTAFVRGYRFRRETLTISLENFNNGEKK